MLDLKTERVHVLTRQTKLLLVGCLTLDVMTATQEPKGSSLLMVKQTTSKRFGNYNDCSESRSKDPTYVMTSHLGRCIRPHNRLQGHIAARLYGRKRFPAQSGLKAEWSSQVGTFRPRTVHNPSVSYPFRFFQAAKLAVERGWAINLGGGFHHSHRVQGGGFCVYADISLAIKTLQEEGLTQKTMIVDLDAHQVNGQFLQANASGKMLLNFPIHLYVMIPFSVGVSTSRSLCKNCRSF